MSLSRSKSTNTGSGKASKSSNGSDGPKKRPSFREPKTSKVSSDSSTPKEVEVEVYYRTVKICPSIPDLEEEITLIVNKSLDSAGSGTKKSQVDKESPTLTENSRYM